MSAFRALRQSEDRESLQPRFCVSPRQSLSRQAPLSSPKDCMWPANTFRCVLNACFASAARFTARHPARAMGMSVLVALLLSTGIALIRIDTGYESVWVPHNTRSSNDKDFVDRHFRAMPRAEFIIIEKSADAAVPAPAANATQAEKIKAADARRGALGPTAIRTALALHRRLVLQGLDTFCLHGLRDRSNVPGGPASSPAPNGTAITMPLPGVSACAPASQPPVTQNCSPGAPDPMAALRTGRGRVPEVLWHMRKTFQHSIALKEGGKAAAACTLQKTRDAVGRCAHEAVPAVAFEEVELLNFFVEKLCPDVYHALVANNKPSWTALLSEPVGSEDYGEPQFTACPIQLSDLDLSVHTSSPLITSTPAAAAGAEMARRCMAHSLLAAFDYDSAQLGVGMTNTNIGSVINSNSHDLDDNRYNFSSLDAALRANGSALHASYTGEPLALEDIIAGLRCEPEATRGESTIGSCRADALQLTYLVDAEQNEIEHILDFESRIMDAIRDVTDELETAGGLRIFRAAQRSFFDANTEGTARDMQIVAASVVLMLLFACLMLGGAPPRHSRVLLGSSAILCVGLALSSAFGICGFVGIPYNETAPMSVFLLLGVGIDDMFIISSCFARVGRGMRGGTLRGDSANRDGVEDDQIALERRMTAAMTEAGVSVALTSITSLAAFVVGGVTVTLPGMRAFCFVCGLAIFNVAWLQCTFYPAVLIFDERRLAANRADCCICVDLGPERTQVNAGSSVNTCADGGNTNEDDPTLANSEPSAASRNMTDRLRDLLAHRFAPWLLGVSPEVALSTAGGNGGSGDVSDERADGGDIDARGDGGKWVVLSFCVLLAVSAIGIARIDKGMHILDFLPDDTPTHNFFDTQGRYFGDVAMSSSYIEWIFRDIRLQHGEYIQDVKYTPGDVLPHTVISPTHVSAAGLAAAAAMQRCFDRVVALNFTRTGAEIWVSEFIAGNWSALSIGSFLMAHPRFGADVSFASDNKSVATSRFRASVNRAATMVERVDQMQRARAACSNLTFELGIGTVAQIDVSAYEPGFLWLERYTMIDRLAVKNMIFALSSNFVVLWALHNARSAATLTVVVGFCDIIIVGMMGWWGVKINIFTLMCLVLAVGFTVDYSAHIAEAFLVGDAHTNIADDREGHASESHQKQRSTQSRSVRAARALVLFGPSVISGGVSTLLAVCLLSLTTDYAFVTLFKMFVLIVLVGLVHGIIILPLLLSWVGTAPLRVAKANEPSGIQLPIATPRTPDRLMSLDKTGHSRQAPLTTVTAQASPVSMGTLQAHVTAAYEEAEV